jgi:tetratricopeptide (TPR) repeat protein
MRALLLAGALAVGLVAAPPPASARSAQEAWSAANLAYQEGRFSEAAALYEDVVAAGILHEHLFYNLGNAYFRTGRLGPAIYNYERALAMRPGLGDARYNLDVARDTVAERVVDRLKGAEIERLWIRIATTFATGQLTVAFLTLNFLFFGLLTVLRFLPTGLTRTALIVSDAFIVTALAATLFVFALHIYHLERVTTGIVLADEVQMREGPGDFAGREQLHPGLRVRILGSDGDWTRIRLSNGGEGWVPAHTVGAL